MNPPRPDKTAILSIAKIQTQLDELRGGLGISGRGAVLFRSDLSYADNEVILVEADGLGGASLLIIDGNYPVDYLTLKSRSYKSESAAIKAAEAMLEKDNF